MWKQLRKLAILGGASVQQKLWVRQRGFSDTACVFLLSKAASSILVAKDGTTFTTVTETNGIVEPSISRRWWTARLMLSPLFPFLLLQDILLTCSPHFQKKSERAPGIDGISVEMLVLGGAETICWLKTIFEPTWVLSQSQRTGRVNSLCRCTCNTGE